MKEKTPQEEYLDNTLKNIYDTYQSHYGEEGITHLKAEYERRHDYEDIILAHYTTAEKISKAAEDFKKHTTKIPDVEHLLSLSPTQNRVRAELHLPADTLIVDEYVEGSKRFFEYVKNCTPHYRRTIGKNAYH